MEVFTTSIDGVVIIKPKCFVDSRGYFLESFSQGEFSEKVNNIVFVQDNESKSEYGVIRGLHFQKPPYSQSKLVRCIQGAVLDVAVDMRVGSPTYGKYESCILTENNHLQFFVPQGFAHGFLVLSETALFQYKCDNFYHPEAEGSVFCLDKDLGISWGLDEEKIVVSEKDEKALLFKDFESPFIYGKNC